MANNMDKIRQEYVDWMLSTPGQASIQAAMESALPIAQADAATRAQFESQNLSNRQQAAMQQDDTKLAA